MENQFKEIEEAFDELKKKFQRGEISRQMFIDGMKKMRLKDEQDHFWMIGAQSGKWYYYDGKDWVQSDPPSQKEQKAICIYCGFENNLESEVCARCGGNLGEVEKVCPKCGAELQEPDLVCPACSRGPEKEEPAVEEAKEERPEGHILRSLHPVSVLYFTGTLGIFTGLILGAFAGATSFFSELTSILPAALRDLQGKLLGAIIFAASGGVAGFLAIGTLGFLLALFINLALSFVGGVKIMLLPAPRKEKISEEKKERKKGLGFDFNLKD
ncbi:MAG: zinc ribbon domain-containing protein [Candidatus Aminicenantales bacterium]